LHLHSRYRTEHFGDAAYEIMKGTTFPLACRDAIENAMFAIS
jgi:hypothetical protein